MCGIANFLYYDKYSYINQLAKMTDAIAHRGPDAEEFFIEDKEL